MKKEDSVARKLYSSLLEDIKSKQDKGIYKSDADMLFDLVNSFSKLILAYIEVIHNDLKKEIKDGR